MRTFCQHTIVCSLLATALPALAQQSNTALDLTQSQEIPVFGPSPLIDTQTPDNTEQQDTASDESTAHDDPDALIDEPAAETDADSDQPLIVQESPTESQADSSESQSLPIIEQQPLGTTNTPATNPSSPLSQLSVVGQTLIALGIVIALALTLRYVIRSAAKRTGSIAGQLTAGGKAPSGVLSILGRYPVARGQTLVLLKLDRRILLLCQTTSGFSTLTSITDPDEVASILTRTEDNQAGSMTHQFQEALQSAESDPATSGDGTLELPDNPFQINATTEDTPQIHVAMDPVASLKKRLEQLGGSSA